MNIQERMDSINGVIKQIAEFIQSHEEIKTDFNEYLRTIGAKSKTGVPLQTACFSYILERNLGEDLKSIPELYLLYLYQDLLCFPDIVREYFSNPLQGYVQGYN